MRNRAENQLASIFGGNRPAAQGQQIPTQPQQGEIVSVSETTATFVFPEYDKSKLYGPAPFCRTDNPPQPGDKCLVVFVGNGIDRAWIVAWAVNS